MKLDKETERIFFLSIFTFIIGIVVGSLVNWLLLNW